MGFADLKRAEQLRQGASREEDIQKVIKAGGQPIGNGQYAINEAKDSTSSTFYDDPLVNALTKLPSVQEAERYTNSSPAFYGVQRPGDWQRVVQREMAGDALPGGQDQLARLEEARRRKASFGQPG